MKVERLTKEVEDKIVELRDQGHNWSEIARQAGTSAPGAKRAYERVKGVVKPTRDSRHISMLRVSRSEDESKDTPQMKVLREFMKKSPGKFHSELSQLNREYRERESAGVTDEAKPRTDEGTKLALTVVEDWLKKIKAGIS